MTYFATGQAALVAIAGKALDELAGEAAEDGEAFLADAQLAFQFLAQRELQTFCDLCRGTCARARAGLVTGRRAGPPPVRRQARRLRPRWAAGRAA